MVMTSESEGWWDLHTVYTHLRREGKGSWRHRGMGHLFMGSASTRLCSAECQSGPLTLQVTGNVSEPHMSMSSCKAS